MNKKFLLMLVLACGALAARAQVPDFEALAKDKKITYLYMSRGIFSLGTVSVSPRPVSVDMQQIIQKLDALQVIRADTKRSSDRAEAAVRRIIRRGGYALLMQLDEDGKAVTIHHGTHDGAKVVILCSREGPKYGVMVFSGDFTLEDMTGLVRQR